MKILKFSITKGQYIGVKPIKLSKSNWKQRNLSVVKKKSKEKQKLGLS